MIQRIFQARDALKTDIRICYLANYDMDLARRLVAGVDVWLNTPEPPLEASGTSGMKAALNGVPSLSVLDGWWIEGCIEGVTGWALGERCDVTTNPGDRAAATPRRCMTSWSTSSSRCFTVIGNGSWTLCAMPLRSTALSSTRRGWCSNTF